jgi:hypothetical protein
MVRVVKMATFTLRETRGPRDLTRGRVVVAARVSRVSRRFCVCHIAIDKSRSLYHYV